MFPANYVKEIGLEMEKGKEKQNQENRAKGEKEGAKLGENGKKKETPIIAASNIGSIRDRIKIFERYPILQTKLIPPSSMERQPAQVKALQADSRLENSSVHYMTGQTITSNLQSPSGQRFLLTDCVLHGPLTVDSEIEVSGTLTTTGGLVVFRKNVYAARGVAKPKIVLGDAKLCKIFMGGDVDVRGYVDFGSSTLGGNLTSSGTMYVRC